jgi:glutaminyl-tRNA synthetase
MGFKPYKVTYTSDYFQELYNFALQLIKDDKAFVCHQPGDKMKADRREGIPSPWRDRPIEESLALFEEMRQGKHEEGTITLRLKMDMKSGNPSTFGVHRLVLAVRRR